MNDINLDRYFRVAIRWLWLIVLSTSLATAVSYRVTKLEPLTYRAETTLIVGDDVTNPALTDQDITLSQRLADGYASMVSRPSILEGTRKALHLQMSWEALGKMVLAAHAGQSQYITIYATSVDPRQAAAIADGVARQLILQSPTEQNLQQLSNHRQFVQQQLDTLQKDIEQTQKDLDVKQSQLVTLTSARDVLDAQEAIKADQSKIATWRADYAALLAPSKGLPSNTLRVIQPAVIPLAPIAPNLRANLLFAAAAGFVLAFAAVLLIEYFNDTVDSVDDLERASSAPLLGAIPRIQGVRGRADALMAVREPDSPVAEAYRFLRTTLRFTQVESTRAALVITSPTRGEGKSVTSANLAASFARSGKRVILVDADLRGPSLSTLFNLAGGGGLSECIEQLSSLTVDLTYTVQQYLIETDVLGLSLLPAGMSRPDANPAELLGSVAMQRVIVALHSMADIVILDTPPVLAVADAVILTGESSATSVVLVVEVGKAHYKSVRLALESLQVAGSRVVGVIANKAPSASITGYRSGYPTKKPGGKSPLRIRG